MDRLFILGSSSRDRQDLMEKAGLVPFIVIVPDIDENLPVDNPLRLAEILAASKADAVLKKLRLMVKDPNWLERADLRGPIDESLVEGDAFSGASPGEGGSRFSGVTGRDINLDEFEGDFEGFDDQIGYLDEIDDLDAGDKVEASSPGGDGIECGLITADTLVVFKSQVFGKAANEFEAYATLSTLQGATHKLLTGFHVKRLRIFPERGEVEVIGSTTGHSITKVKFSHMTAREIKGYIATGEWKGRAGCYAIQHKASQFINSIQGSHSGVIGLPISEIIDALEELGLQIRPRI